MIGLDDLDAMLDDHNDRDVDVPEEANHACMGRYYIPEPEWEVVMHYVGREGGMVEQKGWR